MKTDELTGALLDYWVARAEGLNPAAVAGLGRVCFAENQGKGFEVRRYSTDWAQGGPIIDRERIRLLPSLIDGAWRASYSRIHTPVIVELAMYADTPLVAAMRAYVACKFGDEVPAQEPGEQQAAPSECEREGYHCYEVYSIDGKQRCAICGEEWLGQSSAKGGDAVGGEK